MPVPGEVIGAWVCIPSPDDKDCKADWVMCDECNGEEDMENECSTCTGSGGGYICSTHDTNMFTRLIENSQRN